MTKQLVFIITSDATGAASKSVQCATKGGIAGTLKSVAYIPDAVRPLAVGASVRFFSGTGEAAVFAASDLAGRQTWSLSGPLLAEGPLRVELEGGGEFKSGSFVVTCA